MVTLSYTCMYIIINFSLSFSSNMNYLGLGMVGRAGARFVSSCKDLYNDLNGANLTGAVDVVVVKQIDGSYKSTPFHVRFGKWGVLRTGDLQKEVKGLQQKLSKCIVKI